MPVNSSAGRLKRNSRSPVPLHRLTDSTQGTSSSLWMSESAKVPLTRIPRRELGQNVSCAPANGPLLNFTLSSRPSEGACVSSSIERYHANPPPRLRSHFHDCPDA